MIAKLIAKYLIGEKENLPPFLGHSSITAYTPSTCGPLVLKNPPPPPPSLSSHTILRLKIAVPHCLFEISDLFFIWQFDI